MAESPIRRIREGLGWTQENLSRRADVTLRTVRRLEHGGTPQLTTAAKVAAALGVSLAELYPPDFFPVEEAAS